MTNKELAFLKESIERHRRTGNWFAPGAGSIESLIKRAETAEKAMELASKCVFNGQYFKEFLAFADARREWSDIVNPE